MPPQQYRTNLGEYTMAEKMSIVQYILDNDGHFSLRGNSIWKSMEEDKITQRTWQSMKEHFRRKIINQLHCLNISKEDSKKITSGYNNTRIVYTNVEKSPTRITDFMVFSDEEKENDERPTNSNIATVINEPGSSKKTFKKQILKKKCTGNYFPTVNEPSTSAATNHIPDPSDEPSAGPSRPKYLKLSEEKNKPQKTTPICTILLNDSDSDSDDCVIIDNETLIPAVNENEAFLKSLTAYSINIASCCSIVTFLEQYASTNSNYTFRQLFDKLLLIINDLKQYDFLENEKITQLTNLKDELEIYRSNGYAKVKVVNVLGNTHKFALKPDPALIYINEETLELTNLLKTIQMKKNIMINKFVNNEISSEIMLDFANNLTAFNLKYGPEHGQSTENRNVCEEILNVKQEIIEIDSRIIKEENPSIVQPEVNVPEIQGIIEINSQTIKKEVEIPQPIDVPEFQEIIEINSQSIKEEGEIPQPIYVPEIKEEPEISIDLPNIPNDTQIEYQYLESLTDEELNITNLIGKMIENDLNNKRNF